MGDMTLGEIIGFADSLTTLGTWVLIGWLGMRGTWIFGFLHTAMLDQVLKELATSQASEAAWRTVALKGTGLGEEAVRLLRAADAK